MFTKMQKKQLEEAEKLLELVATEREDADAALKWIAGSARRWNEIEERLRVLIREIKGEKKRGRKFAIHYDRPATAAERQRAYRERKKQA